MLVQGIYCSSKTPEITVIGCLFSEFSISETAYFSIYFKAITVMPEENRLFTVAFLLNYFKP